MARLYPQGLLFQPLDAAVSGLQMFALGGFGSLLWGFVLLLCLARVESSLLANQWGWLYNNGKELTLERRVNIVAMMFATGQASVVAAFVKVCHHTVL